MFKNTEQILYAEDLNIYNKIIMKNNFVNKIWCFYNENTWLVVSGSFVFIVGGLFSYYYYQKNFNNNIPEDEITNIVGENFSDTTTVVDNISLNSTDNMASNPWCNFNNCGPNGFPLKSNDLDVVWDGFLYLPGDVIKCKTKTYANLHDWQEGFSSMLGSLVSKYYNHDGVITEQNYPRFLIDCLTTSNEVFFHNISPDSLVVILELAGF